MDYLEKLLEHEQWLRFLFYKKSGGHLCAVEESALERFVEQKAYLPVALRLNRGGVFSVPELVKVNKRFSEKKRTVFTFPEEENMVQKILAFFLLDLDGLFADNLYSFRKNRGAKTALTRLFRTPHISNMYSFKLDISDYFASVEAPLLLPLLQEALGEQPRLFSLLEAMLTEDTALWEGERVHTKKGILAGSPLSGFLANLFLSELDRQFEKENILYARYSDDIIVFAESEQALQMHRATILSFLEQKHLKVNENKVFFSKPGEAWTFLGFSYHGGTVDICDISKRKLKKKMKRKMRALLRWKNKKQVPAERAVRAYIRYFNNKLYHNSANHELTWARWYFPVINTTESLKELDAYEQQCIRYLATETYANKRFTFTYEQMKALGYVTLVNEYYKGTVSQKQPRCM